MEGQRGGSDLAGRWPLGYLAWFHRSGTGAKGKNPPIRYVEREIKRYEISNLIALSPFISRRSPLLRVFFAPAKMVRP